MISGELVRPAATSAARFRRPAGRRGGDGEFGGCPRHQPACSAPRRRRRRRLILGRRRRRTLLDAAGGVGRPARAGPAEADSAPNSPGHPGRFRRPRRRSRAPVDQVEFVGGWQRRARTAPSPGWRSGRGRRRRSRWSASRPVIVLSGAIGVEPTWVQPQGQRAGQRTARHRVGEIAGDQQCRTCATIYDTGEACSRCRPLSTADDGDRQPTGDPRPRRGQWAAQGGAAFTMAMVTSGGADRTPVRRCPGWQGRPTVDPGSGLAVPTSRRRGTSPGHRARGPATLGPDGLPPADHPDGAFGNWPTVAVQQLVVSTRSSCWKASVGSVSSSGQTPRPGTVSSGQHRRRAWPTRRANSRWSGHADPDEPADDQRCQTTLDQITVRRAEA